MITEEVIKKETADVVERFLTEKVTVHELGKATMGDKTRRNKIDHNETEINGRMFRQAGSKWNRPV